MMAEDAANGLLRKLTGLCAGAQASVLLVAPFIKVDIITELVGAIDDCVELTVVTRWHPEEIASQVSDLAIWPVVRDRGKSSLLLQQRLHAKYYKADQECLIGSANLTASALAGSDMGNLELLVNMSVSDPQLRGFEERLVAGALPVDDGLYNMYCQLVASIRPKIPPAAAQVPERPAADWHPHFRVPAELYRVYQGAVDYPYDVLHAAQEDLHALAPPPGLGQRSFEAAIGIALRSTNLIQNLDLFLGTGERRFGEVRDWMAGRIGQADEEGRATQSLIRWLTVFLPDRYLYRRPGYSELLSLRVK